MRFETDPGYAKPFGGYVHGLRANIDGLLCYNQSMVPSYCQMFRHGAVESVSAYPYFGVDNDSIATDYFKDAVMESLTGYLEALNSVGVPPPLVITVSLIGVKNLLFYPYGYNSAHLGGVKGKFDRSNITSVEVLLEDYSSNLYTALQPLWDSIWQSVGYSNCWWYLGTNDWAKHAVHS